MKYILYIASILLSTQISAQEGWVNEFDEEQSKYHFDCGLTLYDAVHNVLQIDNQLASLDTSILENRIEYDVLSNHKKQLLHQALVEFEKTTDSHPEGAFFNLSLQYKGKILIELNELDRARNYFERLSKQDIPFEVDTTNTIDERYFTYKNTIYQGLAEIEYQSANYSKAIEHLDQSEKFRYIHFCGGQYMYDEKEIATKYAKNYFALGSHEKAVEVLMPHILSDGHSSHKQAINDAINYLLHTYSRSNLIEKFESAIQNSSVEYIDAGLATYTLNYLGYTLDIFTTRPQNVNGIKAELDEVMKNERFYQALIDEKHSQNK